MITDCLVTNADYSGFAGEKPAIVPDSWHRLKVKTIAAISNAATVPAGFVIFIDGLAVSSAEAKGEAGSALDALNPAARKWAAGDQLIPSLIKSGEANASTLTGVDLVGSGMIDNLYFTNEAPAFAVDLSMLTLTWDEYVESLVYSINGGEAVKVVSSPPVCKIGDTEYGTLADAFAAAVPGAETTIALVGDISAQAYGVIAADAKIKRDLAGHTITGGTFEGEILRDGATVEIYNGSFSGSPDAFVLKDCLPDWYEYEYANGFWTVIELPMPNYYYLEIPEVFDASPIISNYDTNEPIEDTGNIREDTRVSVVWEPWEGYKIIDSAREIITMNGPKSVTAPNVKEIHWATVVIKQVVHCTITVVEQDFGKTVESDALYDSDDWMWLIITCTPAVGYALVDCKATEKICITEAQDYVITAKVEPLSYPSYIPSTASDATKLKFETWVAEMAGGNRDKAGANFEAYLLNVAPADAAKEAKLFKVTAISVGTDGAVTVTTTTTNSSGKEYNGKIICKGKEKLGDAEWLPKDDAKHRFFKVFLEVK